MLLSPLDIFKESWQIYKANWKTFMRVLLWPFIVLVLVAIVNLIVDLTNTVYVSYTFPTYLALSALGFVIGLWANIVLIRLIWSSLTHQTVDKQLFYETAWRDTVPYLWVSFIAGFIILLGTILFIIPGVIFTVWYSLATFIFVIEGARGYDALKKSRALIEGRFWQILQRWIVPNLFTAIFLIIIVGLPTLIIGYFTGFADFNPTSNATPWWSTLINSIGSLIILPMTICFAILIYKTLKENPQENLPTPTKEN